MARAKRKLEEFDLSKVASTEYSNAIVHGIETEKKRMKVENIFVVLCLTANVQIVSFELSLRVAVDSSLHKEELTVTSVVDCQV